MKQVNKQKSMKFRRFKRFLPVYLMAAPALIYLLINNYIPMSGIIIAFKNYKFNKGVLGSDWAGMKNFVFLFKTKDAWMITRNTILYNLIFIVLGTVLAIFTAILINEIRSKTAKRVYQTVVIIPYLLSMVVVSYLVNGFLAGDLGFINNTILPALGKSTVSWYNEPKYWPFILVFVQLWFSVGYHCVIYLASLVGIDAGYYEAAAIDGANAWHKIRYITLPFLKPTIMTLTLLAVGRIFYSDFGLFYMVPLNSGALYNVTSTIDTYVYRGLMQSSNVSMASAAGLYQSTVGFVLVITANLVVNKFSKENALF
jgi:putative aldouronate transport system permease protein